MLRSILLVLLLAGAAPAWAEVATERAAPAAAYPTLPAHVAALKDLVPPGWTIETQAQGVLDEAARPAFALVLHAEGTAPVPEMLPRILVVALQTPDGGYDVVLQNHTLIPLVTREESNSRGYDLGRRATDSDNVDKPGLEFHRGALRVRVYAWSTMHTLELDSTFAFRLHDGKFLLIGYDGFAVTSGLGSATWSLDFLSRKISFSKGKRCVGRDDVVKHCRWTSESKLMTPRPLQSIEEIGNGMNFEPQFLWPMGG